MSRRLVRWAWVAAGLGLVLLSVVPVGWTGGHDAGPPWAIDLQAWAIGGLTVGVVALLLGWLARGTERRGRLDVRLPDRVVVPVLTIALVVGAALVMRLVFASNPRLVDEMAQLFHARVFAAGRLAAPAPQPREAFLIMHTWVTDAGWVSLYPPGQTALLALGILLGAPWLVNPIVGGLSLLLVFRIARNLYGRRTAVAAAFLWASSAWVLFMSATYTSHVGVVAFTLAAWALVFGGGDGGPAPWRTVAAGVAVGLATVTRPLDGVAAVVPVLVWIAARRRWRRLPWLVAGGLPVALAWAWLNWRMYGDALTTGYGALYGQELELGFLTDPWGRPFTPLVALGNAVVAVRRLSIHLFEWPIPALVPLVAWALGARHAKRADVVLLAGVVAAPILYFFYWHSGFYMGPRFYYAAAPMLVIGTARAWRWAWVGARRAHGRWIRWDVAVGTAALVVLAWGWTGVLPQRLAHYRAQFPALKLHPERELVDRGVERALVLVPQSWGSRVISRLWSLGAPPGIVERAYRRVDTCALHRLAAKADSTGASPAAVTASLERLSETPEPSARMIFWPDPTIRLTPGSRVPPDCAREMGRDLEGFTIYGHLLWRNAVGLDGGVVFAQDLFDRNALLLKRYRGWDIWRYAPPPGVPGEPPVLVRYTPAADNQTED